MAADIVAHLPRVIIILMPIKDNASPKHWCTFNDSLRNTKSNAGMIAGVSDKEKTAFTAVLNWTAVYDKQLKPAIPNKLPNRTTHFCLWNAGIMSCQWCLAINPISIKAAQFLQKVSAVGGKSS